MKKSLFFMLKQIIFVTHGHSRLEDFGPLAKRLDTSGPGHSKTLICLDWNNCIVALAACLGWFSCWKVNLLLSKSSAVSNKFTSRILLYLAPFPPLHETATTMFHCGDDAFSVLHVGQKVGFSFCLGESPSVLARLLLNHKQDFLRLPSCCKLSR